MFKKELLRLEFHQLVNYGPSLLNRDKNGNIKEVTQGGTRRARLSSQCIKHAMRNYGFSDAIRTRRIFAIVEEKLREIKNEDGTAKYDDEYINCALQMLELFFSKKDKNGKGETISKQSITYSKTHDIPAIVGFFTNNYPETADLKKFLSLKVDDRKKDQAYMDFLKECKNRRLGSNIALYGRMVVDAIVRHVESAVCMNHAYTINPINGDSDYFAAVEEYVKDGEAVEASMLDTVNIESGCFYKYASVDMNTFLSNLCIGEDLSDEEVIARINEVAEDEVIDFFEKYMNVAPVAKQHSNATSPKPVITYVRITESGFPCTMDDKFEKPVTFKRDKSIAEQGIERVVDFITDETYETKGLVEEFVIVGKDKRELIPDGITVLTEKEAKQVLRNSIQESLQ